MIPTFAATLWAGGGDGNDSVFGTIVLGASRLWVDLLGESSFGETWLGQSMFDDLLAGME